MRVFLVCVGDMAKAAQHAKSSAARSKQRVVCKMVGGRQKCRQHPDFPGGHPPEYYPSLKLLDFADRTGYGIFSLRWPSTSEITHKLGPITNHHHQCTTLTLQI